MNDTAQLRYDSGFSWAATELLRKRCTPDWMEAVVTDPIDNDEFDAGARDALTAYRTLLTTSEFQPKVIEREL